MLYRIACLAVVSLLITGLSASESVPAKLDFPDADALLCEATRSFLEIVPNQIEGTVVPVLQQRIAKHLAEQGQYNLMFAIISERNFSEFMSIVRKQAFERDDFNDYIKVLQLPYAERYSLTDTYRTILTALINDDRIGEAEKFYGELPERDQRLIGSFADFQARQKRLYTIFPKDENGQISPKLLSAFPQFGAFHYRNMPLADAIFYYSHNVPDQVWEAIGLFNESKPDEAKVLFDQAVAKLSEHSGIRAGGSIGNTHIICGVAAIQIELGKPDWAKETLHKAVTFYKQKEQGHYWNQHQHYPVKALVNIMVALGEIDAIRKLIDSAPPLRVHSDSSSLFCDIAVILAKNGDKTGAADVLRKVMTVAEAVDHPVVLREVVNSLAEAASRIGDKELCREFIDRALRLAEKFDGDNQWSERSDIRGAIVLAQCGIEDFDGAGKNLKEMVLFQYEPHFSTFVDTLITLKKYDVLEPFLREKEAGDGRHFVPAWRAIALAKFADGDQAGAVEAIKAAIYSAKNDGSGYTYGVPTLLVDIAMDLKYLMSDEPGRASMESINETILWHQNLMDRESTDAGDYTEEELRHLLRIFGKSNNSPEAIQARLRGMGTAIYPVIFGMARDIATEGRHFSPPLIFQLIDIEKADKEQLRLATLSVHARYPYVNMYNDILGEVGLPEDVP